MLKFLKKLVPLGYHSPIGRECYHVAGDREEDLTRSMAAWRKFSAKMAEEKSLLSKTAVK